MRTGRATMLGGESGAYLGRIGGRILRVWIRVVSWLVSAWSAGQLVRIIFEGV